MTIAYDNNGNTKVSAGITNTYDFENRMTQHGTNPGLLLTYDGDGNRVSETVGGTTTKFLVDDENPTGLPQVLDELVNASVTRTYAYGKKRISENQLVNSTWTPSFYGYDGHGNARRYAFWEFTSCVAKSAAELRSKWPRRWGLTGQSDPWGRRCCISVGSVFAR